MKKLFTTLIVLLAVAFNLPAQNVYISPETGHLIAAVTYDSEVGFENGFSALWRHDQLGLSVVVADDDNLTTGKEIANPAGNLNTVNGKLTLTGGMQADCYMVVSLPKGYRFTGYSITLNNDMNGHQYTRDFTTANIGKIFYETGEDFNYNSNQQNTGLMGGTNDNKDYTIGRDDNNMGNRLYFRLHHNSNGFYGVSIKNFEVKFVADADFDQLLQALPTSQAVGVEKSPFMVGKPELGTIKPNTKTTSGGKSVTYYSYDYRNVDDLEADNLLYQSNAVVNGKADDSQLSTKTINRTIYDGHNYFALTQGSEADNTYFIETPVTLTSVSGKEFPTGYRITGATLEFIAPDNDVDGGLTIGVNTHGEITYLHSDGTMASNNPETGWSLNNNRLTAGRNSIYVYQTSGSNGYYYITNQQRGYFSNPASFYTETVTENGKSNTYIYTRIRGNKMYIHESNIPGERAILSSSRDGAAQYIAFSGIKHSTTGFSVDVYGTSKDTPAQTVTLASGGSQTVELKDLNNDAIKFQVKGLSDGGQALVRITLKMQHLNPYIQSMEIKGTDSQNTQNTLTQTFTADNFSVRGGHFVFPIPEGSNGHKWTFTFDKLTSKYTDGSYKSITDYAGGTDGNARISFVESPYFQKNENLYADSYNPDYTPVSDKVQVTTVGTVPFRFNNADQLSNENESEFESQLEEYPFSVEQYKKDNGYGAQGDFQQFSLTPTNNENNEGIAYIVVADETKYNIAPTTATQHRYYAHYVMDIELQETEYNMTVNAKKVYDKTFYTDEDNNDKDDSMWGIEISTDAGNTGYAHLTDIIENLNTLVANTDAQSYKDGLTSLKQVLYVDLSGLSSIILPSSTGGANDYFYNFRELFSPNCLIYLPNGTANSIDNFAYKSQTSSGSYTANRNIIITDRYPFYAPYDISVGADNYSQYTRVITHAKSGKENITTLALPFSFKVSGTDSKHTNANMKDGDKSQSFTVCKLSKDNALSSDKGDNDDVTFDDFNSRMVVNYNNYVHFEKLTSSDEVSTKAYEPYLIYISDADQLEGDDNFTVIEKGAGITHTSTESTTSGSTTTTSGKIKLADESGKVSGTLDKNSFTLTPTTTMAGCKLDKNSEPCLYFAGDRFRSSWTLIESLTHVNVRPFRAWFDYSGKTNAKDNYYGIAFGFSGNTTGINGITTDKPLGTYKFIRNGQLYIHTDKGTFTEGGQKVNL